MDINEGRIFTTTNVDLATFLVIEEIKLLEVAVHDAKRKIIAFRFFDEKLNCLDLEKVFIYISKFFILRIKIYPFKV